MSPQWKHAITVRRNTITNVIKHCDEEAEQIMLAFQLQRQLQGLKSTTTRHKERVISDLALRQIQDYIRSHTTAGEVSLTKAEGLVQEGS
jgi:hypothetical protein